MPAWTSFKKKYSLDVGDLPNQHAPNVVAVSLLDGEADFCEREGKRNAAMNVREVERKLKAAISRARGGAS